MEQITRAICILLFAATPLMAQNGSLHREAPFTYVTLSDCGGEQLAFTGTMYGMVRYTTAGDKLIMNLHMGTRGDSRAVGLETGNVYNVVSHVLTRYVVTDKDTDTMILSYSQETKIVGLFTIHYNYSWKFTGIFGDEEWIGNVKMEAENFRTVCK